MAPLLASLLASLAACSLGRPDTHQVVISMPEGGFGPELAIRSEERASARLTSVIRASSGTNSQGSNYSKPSSILDFKCVGVMVTGLGIAPDVALGADCKANPKVMPNGLGHLVGLVPVIGGQLVVEVPSGPGRTIQLIGVQANSGCPNVVQAMNEALNSPNGGSHMDLGEPYEIGRVTADVFADQTLNMEASYTVATAEPMFSCHEGEQTGSGGGGGDNRTLLLTDLDLFPHYPSSSNHFRVLGRFEGEFTSIQMHRNSACTDPYTSATYTRTYDRFAINVSGSEAYASSPIYVKAINTYTGQSTPCVPVPGAGYQYGSGNVPRVKINTAYGFYPGLIMDAQVLSTGVDITGDRSYNTGTVTLWINGVSMGACSGGSSSFSCASQHFTGLPDGLIWVSLKLEQTSPTVETADDGFYVFKDSLAPGLVISSSVQNAVVTGAQVAGFPVSGTCGGSSGSPIEIVHRTPGGASTTLVSLACAAGTWGGGIDLSAFPDGDFSLEVSHWDAGGRSHSSTQMLALTKAASIVDRVSLVANSTSEARGLVKSPSDGGIYAVGGASGHWLVRRFNGSTWSTMDNFEHTAGYVSTANSVVVTPSGAIIVAGFGADSSYVNHWIVRRSIDSGVNWTTVHDFSLYAGRESVALSMAVNPVSGDVIIAGYGQDAGYVKRWVVTRSTNDGANWSTWETYAPGYDAEATVVAVHALNGDVFVGGGVKDTYNHETWMLRKFNGAWTVAGTLDDYSGGTYAQRITGMAIDGAANVAYVAGVHSDVNYSQHWKVKTFAITGSTWSTIDDFLPPNVYGGTQTALPRVVAFGPGGSVLVGGQFNNPSPAVGQYVLRKYTGGVWTTASMRANGSTPWGVAAIAVFNGTIYSAGDLSISGGSQRDWIVKSEPFFQ